MLQGITFMFKITSLLLIAVTLFFSIIAIDKDCITSSTVVYEKAEIVQDSYNQNYKVLQTTTHGSTSTDDSESHACHIGHCSLIFQKFSNLNYLILPLTAKAILQFHFCSQGYYTQKLRPPSLS